MTENNLLAIDGDGVKLNYNGAYPAVWKAAFGTDLTKVRPNCYHAENEYGVQFESPEQRRQFFDAFGDSAWSSMEALDGAVEATQMLSAAGYRIVCVSSMPMRFQDARLLNFQKLGMPVERVIATGRGDAHLNPKLEVLRELRPAAFVDNLLANFEGVTSEVHRAFIDYKNVDSPNTGMEARYPHDSVHGSLLEFAAYWLHR